MKLRFMPVIFDQALNGVLAPAGDQRWPGTGASAARRSSGYPG